MYVGSPTPSRNFMNFGHKRLNMGPGPECLPTLYIFYFIARLCTRRSANRTQPLFCDMLGSEPDLQMRDNNLRSSLPEQRGAKTAYFVTVLISRKL